MQYKYRKKKKRSKIRMSWIYLFYLLIFEGFPNRVLVYPDRGGLKREKWDVEKKSGVMKIEHYSKTCWSREEEARYLQSQMYELRAFKNTSVFQTHGKIHILSLDQIVQWVMGSFEFLTRDYFFVRWLNSRGVSYQGQWSVVPLYDRDGLPCSRKAKLFADVVLEVERA